MTAHDVSKLARELSEKHRDNRLARIELEEMANADPALYEALTRSYLTQACTTAILSANASERRSAWKTAATEPTKPAVKLADLAAIQRATLMDNFVLPSGQRLGDAVRSDLSLATAVYRSKAEDMASKASWLSLIQQGLPEGKSVREHYTEQRLIELQTSAVKNVGEAA